MFSRVRLEVTPKDPFGALARVVMAASTGRQEAQSQSFAAFGPVQIALQGIADQACHGNLFPLGQKLQLTIRAFFHSRKMAMRHI
jgi:hypothetical protein